jgi:hypothetical protein
METMICLDCGCRWLVDVMDIHNGVDDRDCPQCCGSNLTTGASEAADESGEETRAA